MKSAAESLFSVATVSSGTGPEAGLFFIRGSSAFMARGRGGLWGELFLYEGDKVMSQKF